MLPNYNNCGNNCCATSICVKGQQGPTGPRGPQGPPGIVNLSNYLTARVDNSTTVAPNNEVIFGGPINISGTNITHQAQTVNFTVVGGQTYRVFFSINSENTTFIQGMTFALKVNNFITDTRIVTQNVNPNSPFESGSAVGYVNVPIGTTANISIINIGLDTLSVVNGSIDILQITNN